MNDKKCERVDGILKPCDDMAYNTGLGFMKGRIPSLHAQVAYCPFCGGYIKRAPIVEEDSTTIKLIKSIDESLKELVREQNRFK